MSAGRALLLGLASLAIGCGGEDEVLPPLGHFVVHVDTDAPVPRADGTEDPDAPAPLFDRLALDFYLPGEVEPCGACTRQIELTDEQLRAGATFTARDEHPEGRLRVRARMFRADELAGGTIPPDSTVEVVAQLPKQPAEGALDVKLFLATDKVGSPEGTLDAPVDLSRGKSGKSRVGTWAGARRVPCAGAPSDTETCAPGGAFWMGNPLVSGGGTSPANRRRLVVLSPFFVDLHELTVAELRATGLGSMPGVGAWSGKLDGGSIFDLCTYAPLAGVHDAFPAACVSFAAARKICQARGGDLPSEAQLEYLAGAMASRLYVWGHDGAACGDAVFGVNAQGLQAIGLDSDGKLPCAPPEDRTPEETFGAPFPAPSDETSAATLSRRRDRLALGGRTIYDLGGNLQEWTLDLFQKQDEPCWNGSRGHILYDPICDEPGASGSGVHTTRGGMWGSTSAEMRAAARTGSEDKGGPPVGLRCVRPGG